MIRLLFQHLSESTLVCILLGSLTFCLRRQRAAARHSLWLLSLVKFVLPTMLLSASGAWIAFVLPADAWVSSLAIRFWSLLAGLFGTWPSALRRESAPLTSIVLLTIWALGSALMFGAWFRKLRTSYANRFIASQPERVALERLKQRLGFQSAVGIGRSQSVKEPALLGIFRPFISIPQGLSEELTAAEFDAVLLHELAHSRRHDNLAAALVHGLVCVFWFHPLLWFVEKRLIAERERACDEMVIECGTARETYLAGIAKVCKFHLLGNVAGVGAGISHMTGSVLNVRFEQILGYRKSHSTPYSVRLVVAAIALFTTVLPVAGGYCEQCVSNDQGATSSKISFHR